ncbi:hypothetical protein ACQSMD_26625 [Streptomyces flavovirens]|uniref:hypothetical protein n=1 Tax=Streptomyces flavovirens TaxID=52258 RepID=UPI003D12C075
MLLAYGDVDSGGRSRPERPAQDALTAWREDGRSRLRHRFQRAVDEGDLPSATDPDLLARYVMTVANGIAVRVTRYGHALREATLHAR